MNDMTNVRVENLKKLLERFESITVFGRAVSTGDSYIGHCLNGRRNIGRKVCARIEKSLSLPEEWMDINH